MLRNPGCLPWRALRGECLLLGGAGRPVFEKAGSRDSEALETTRLRTIPSSTDCAQPEHSLPFAASAAAGRAAPAAPGNARLREPDSWRTNSSMSRRLLHSRARARSSSAAAVATGIDHVLVIVILIILIITFTITITIMIIIIITIIIISTIIIIVVSIVIQNITF